MKYLFINVTAGAGSTGRIVADTCRQLMAQGHECRIAYGRRAANCEDIPTIRIGSDWDTRLNALQARIFDNSGFGTRGPTKRFLEQVRDYDPDVIWLHNIHGYYLRIDLLFAYLRTCGKEIRWTLHDCWAMTGHCVHFDYVGCEKWKTQCGCCPQKGQYPASILCDRSRKNYIRKRESFTGIPNLTLITPSNWLAERVRAGFLREYPVQVVYNQVDRTVFKPTPGDFRRKYGLEDRIILLGVANIWDSRKGLADFLELAKLADQRFQIVLVGLSAAQIAKMPDTILALPRTDNVQQLAELYTAADFYLNASVEETFGMTVLEAISCGTHPIVYKGTACEEVVGIYGGTAVPRGPDHLLQAVIQKIQEK